MGTTAFTACAGVLKREVDQRELTTDTQNGNGKWFDCLLTPETSAVIRKELGFDLLELPVHRYGSSHKS